MIWLPVLAVAPPAGLTHAVKLRPNVVAALTAPSGTRDGHPVGSQIVVRVRTRGEWRTVWRHKNLNPWKLESADVDGDGKLDLVAGVWKKSRFDPTMQKRLFVYDWTGRLLKPKWLGSRLTRRFDDFTLAPGDRGPWRLYALENGVKGEHRISAYEWSGFGFKWLAASGDYPHLTAIEHKGRYVWVRGTEGLFRMSLIGGKVVLRGPLG